jgi:hypothetical protein
MTQPPSITGSGVTLSGASASADGTKITVNYTTTSSATTGSRTITVTTSGGSATGTVNVSNATIQLQWFQWTANQDGNSAHGMIHYYRDSQNSDWTLDKMADEGGSQITQPTWDGGSGNGTVTENDPVAYTGGTTPAITNIILTAADGISASAKLRVATNQGALTFPETQIQFNNGTATLSSPTAVTAQAALPAAIANMDLELTWSVSFDQGQTWQVSGFIQTDHTMFVTLANPRGFDGDEDFASSGHVTAARMNYATRVLSGMTDSDSSVKQLQRTVPGAFGRGANTIASGNPWVALDNPSQNPNLDCYNLAAVGVVQLLEAGIDSTVFAAYPTPNGDATTQWGLKNQQNQYTDILKFYANDGVTVYKYEGFVALNQSGQAASGYTFFPTMGPFAPWTSPPVTGLPTTSLGQLAFQMLYQELSSERTDPQNSRSGQQYYFSTTTGAQDQGPIPFLGFTQ